MAAAIQQLLELIQRGENRLRHTESIFDLKGLPQPGDAYVAIPIPAQLERTDEGWRITE